tara:strand:+ start:730 stop:936 length:207 start_codon:yes stop_codon:yes gene_type:complete
MTLSKPVEESLRASQEHLRDALAFAARGEKPFISKHIASFLADIDNLIDAQDMMQNIRDQLTKRDEED